jgi:hypothetical protein
MSKTAKHEITIIVEGGMIQDVKIPKGCHIKVRVKDFDIEGTEADHLQTDENGDEFVELIYEN